jgi:hypothetical protein
VELKAESSCINMVSVVVNAVNVDFVPFGACDVAL